MTRISWVVAVALGAATLGACGEEQDQSVSAVGNVTTTARSIVTTAPGSDGAIETAASGTPEGIPDIVFGVDEVVRFDAGGTSAVLDNAVVRGERNRYTLGASAGQTMILSITSDEDNAVFDVYAPDETTLSVEATSASIELPSDGDYTIIVGGTRGNATYQLTVEIPAP